MLNNATLIKACLLTGLLFFFFLSIGYSQGTMQVPSPNTAALGTFGQYPKSSFTGVPDISVPLFDLSEGTVPIPVSLSYNTNGVRPELQSSWVGLGWNLSAGGAITRVVNEKPDDLPWFGWQAMIDTHDVRMGYFYNHSYLSANDWATAAKIDKATTDEVDIPKVVRFPADYTTIRDYAPDEFSFTIGRLSGSFYMDDQGNWKVRSERKVTVVIGDDDFQNLPSYVWKGLDGIDRTIPANRYLIRITLIDDEGIKYIFGGDNPSYELISEGNGDFAKSWYITQIIFPNNRRIAFKYQNGQASKFVQYNTWYHYITWSGPGGTGLTYDQQTIRPVYLKTIQTDLRTIDFMRSERFSEFAKLDAIVVKSAATGEPVKAFAFNYINSPMSQMKLFDLTEKDKYGNINKLYKFHYNPITFNPATKYTDHWGFYNTKRLNPSNETNFYASKDADIANCRAELLSEIVYPTGGISQYNWEPNTYTTTMDGHARTSLITLPQDAYAGGVRIKAITNIDNSGALIGSKRYFYTKTYTPSGPGLISSGVLYAKPFYIYVGPSYYKFQPTLPLSANNVGSHVSYSTVTEVSEDGSYMTTDYSNFDNGVNGEYMDENPLVQQNLIYKYYSQNSHERGRILSERAFTNAGAPVQETNYTYQRLNKSTEFVRSYNNFILEAPVYDFNSRSGAAFKIYTNPYLMSSKTVKDFVGGTQVNQTTNYTYDTSNLNLVNTSSVNSKGESIDESIAYPTDMVNGGEDPDKVYANMVAAGMTAIPIKRTSKLNGTTISTNLVNYTMPSDNIFLPGTETVQYGNTAARNIAEYVFDDYKNIVSSTKPGSSSTSFKYIHSNRLPVVKIVNAKTTATYDPTYLTDGVQLPLGSAQTYTLDFNKKNNDQLMVSMGFNCNPTGGQQAKVQCTLTGPNNYSQSFKLCLSVNDPGSNAYVCGADQSVYTFSSLPPGQYKLSATYFQQVALSCPVNVGIQYVGRSRFARLTNEFYYEGFEENNAGLLGDAHTGSYYSTNAVVNWARPNTKTYKISYWFKTNGIWNFSGDQPYSTDLFNMRTADGYDDIRIFPADADMTTYTYDPIAGITSSIDMRGETRYFEYDDFQRLKAIKDGNRDIIKLFSYNYYRTAQEIPPPPIYYNFGITKDFVKNDCQPGTGMTVTYGVISGSYSASTQEAADALAQADINANGQNFANANGGCILPPPAPPTPFVRFTRTSGSTSGNETTGIYEFKLFSDDGFSVPYVAPSDYTINFSLRASTSVNGGTPTVSTTPASVVIVKGTSAKSIAITENTCGGGSTGPVAVASKSTSTTNTVPPGGGGQTTCTTKTIIFSPAL